MSARPDLAGVLLAQMNAEYGDEGWAELGSLRRIAAALNTAIDAWLADEGTREAVGAAIYEATYEVGIDDGVTLDQGRDIAATALTALTTPTTTEDHR